MALKNFNNTVTSYEPVIWTSSHSEGTEWGNRWVLRSFLKQLTVGAEIIVDSSFPDVSSGSSKRMIADSVQSGPWQLLTG